VRPLLIRCPVTSASVELIDESHRLLGRHVRRRPERSARSRSLGGRASHLRDAEVEHLHLTRLGDEDVRRLQIAVDDADRVTGSQTVEDRVGDLEHLGDGHHAPGALPGLAHRLAFQQIHDEEGLFLLRHVVVEHAHACDVADLVGDVRLAQEAIAHHAVAREVRMEDLEGGPLAVAMRRRIHRGHPADA